MKKKYNMQFRLFKPVKILYKGIIPVTTTRFPWLHKNFSGVPGWKQNVIKELEDKFEVEQEQHGNLKTLFKAFGYLVMLDSDKAEFWKLPKLTCSALSIRAGWLYWAIAIMRTKVYYIPRHIREEYEFLSDENKNTLFLILRESMNTGNSEMLMDAMDIMLKLGYINFRINLRVVSKSGDRIKYTVTYPKTRVIIESVNGIQNQVLCAKYHHMLSAGDLEDRKRGLLHKDDMTPEQLEWLGKGVKSYDLGNGIRT